jgi:hypothetical protein
LQSAKPAQKAAPRSASRAPKELPAATKAEDNEIRPEEVIPFDDDDFADF